jgi:hypothetical protein
MGFAQRKQTQRVIEIAVGEHDSGDRRMARPARMQRRIAFNL